MQKFATLDALLEHKREHSESEGEDLTKIDEKKAEPIQEEPLFERKKIHTCYICMQKFATLDALFEHKREHSESEGEDDLFEEDSSSQDNKMSDESNTEQKVKNLDVLLKNPALPLPSKKGKKTKLRKGSSATTITPKDDTKENKIKSKARDAEATSLDKDTTTQNSVKSPFKCDTCNVFFATSDEAKTHIPPSALKCKFSCHLCNRKFNTLYALIVHIMQHKNDAFKNQNSSKSLYNCKLCNNNFTDCFQLKRHEIKIHKKETHIEPAYAEPTEIMTTHVVLRESDTETQLTCDLCYDVFNTKEEFDNHTEFHKQLDMITQPTSYDTNKDDSNFKLVEDARDKQGLVTSQKKNTVTIPYDKLISLPSTSSTQNKKNLTATIKEMIAPNELKAKQSKTIFLPNIEEEKLEEKRKRICAKFNIVHKNVEAKRKKRQILLKLVESDSTRPFNKAGTSFQKPKKDTLLNPTIPAKLSIPVISHATFASTSFVATSVQSTSNIPNNILSASSSYAKNPSIFPYMLLSNSSSVSKSLLVSPSIVSLAPSKTINTNNIVSTVSNIPRKYETMNLPKIESVMSLAESIEPYDKIITTNEGNKPTVAIDDIVILDSDSDEETNLIIDETLLKVEPSENIGKPLEVEPETDDVDDHFEEDECHTTIAENSKSNEDFPKTCSNCQSIFDDHDAFNNHENKKINCKRCDYQSCEDTDLNSHYISVHKESHESTVKGETKNNDS